MINFGKIIDKLIEISTSDELSEEARSSLDMVIEELVEYARYQLDCGHNAAEFRTLWLLHPGHVP